MLSLSPLKTRPSFLRVRKNMWDARKENNGAVCNGYVLVKRRKNGHNIVFRSALGRRKGICITGNCYGHPLFLRPLDFASARREKESENFFEP